MRKGVAALSIGAFLVGLTASFVGVTYAAYSASDSVDQTIGVKRCVYLNIGSTDWDDETYFFSAWVWQTNKSGYFAGMDSFMQPVSSISSTLFRIFLPADVQHISFVKHTGGATASWLTMKKTKDPKVAFQTIDLDINSNWDTYTITQMAEGEGAYTDDGYQKWAGSASLEHNTISSSN